jgi:hypothetical protein
VGICAFVIVIVFEGISLASLVEIILHIIVDFVAYINKPKHVADRCDI